MEVKMERGEGSGDTDMGTGMASMFAGQIGAGSNPEGMSDQQLQNPPVSHLETCPVAAEAHMEGSRTCVWGVQVPDADEKLMKPEGMGAISLRLMSHVGALTEKNVLAGCTEDHGQASHHEKSKEDPDGSATATDPQLMPGLPNDVAILCLARVARGMMPTLSLVCKSWRDVVKSADFPSLRQQVESSEGWIYVLAETPPGSPFRVFDPTANKWHNLPPIPGHSPGLCCQGFVCVALGCCLYFMGGIHRAHHHSSQQWTDGIVSSDVKVYNAHTNRWSTAASMNTARSWFAATVIGDKVYVAGGRGVNSFLNSAEVYDSAEDAWRPIRSMHFIRSSSSGVALDGQFWVVAGEYMRSQYEDRPRKGSAEVYDPQSDTWRVVNEMWLDCHKVPGPSTVVDGRLIFIHYSRIMAYDHDSNCWMHVGHVSGGDVYNRPVSRFGFACVSLDREIYIIGGTKESWQNRNRYHIQTLNTVEVCSSLRCRDVCTPQFLPWRQVADMGTTCGNVLASAVLRL